MEATGDYHVSHYISRLGRAVLDTINFILGAYTSSEHNDHSHHHDNHSHHHDDHSHHNDHSHQNDHSHHNGHSHQDDHSHHDDFFHHHYGTRSIPNISSLVGLFLLTGGRDGRPTRRRDGHTNVHIYPLLGAQSLGIHDE